MTQKQTELRLIRMSEVELQEVRWLWYPYIPQGKLTIIQGNPGEGKTTLALWIAAMCSQGQALPGMGSGEPVNILYQTAEDGLGDTIKPRLMNSGSDLTRIMCIDETEHSLSLLDERIEKAVKDTNAKLLILDPLQGYLGRDVDMNRANEIRDILKRLTLIADQTGCSIATGMRRGECCGLKWCDVNFNEKSIHICRNVVKVTGEDIIVKEPKTASGDRYVYFSAEMASLLKEYRKFCEQETETYDERELTPDDYIFRRHGMELPMTPSSFTWRFKLILKKHGLPENLNIHSLRHTAASLMIAGGADVATVSGLLGHSQVSTTLDIYTHAFDDKKKAASAVLQESLDI